MISESEERYFKALRDRYARVCELYPTNKAGSEGDRAIHFCRMEMLCCIASSLESRGIVCEFIDPPSPMMAAKTAVNHYGGRCFVTIQNRTVFFQSLRETVDSVLQEVAESIDGAYPLPWSEAKEQP